MTTGIAFMNFGNPTETNRYNKRWFLNLQVQHPWGRLPPCWASPLTAVGLWAAGWSGRSRLELPEKVGNRRKIKKCSKIKQYLPTETSSSSPHRSGRRHDTEKDGSSTWQRPTAGTSAGTWQTHGHQVWYWFLSWRLSARIRQKCTNLF